MARRGIAGSKNFMIVVGVSILAILVAAATLYYQQKKGASRAKFAMGTGGYGYGTGAMPIPSGYPETERLSYGGSTELFTAGILRGAAKHPDSDIDYTLRNIRPLDNSFTTGAFVGTLKSEQHTESGHGEFSYKNQDYLRNSTLAIPVTVPGPITVPKISIAGQEWNGVSYQGGIGLMRGPQHALTIQAPRPYVNYPIAGGHSQAYPHFPVAGAYRAGSKGYL